MAARPSAICPQDFSSLISPAQTHCASYRNNSPGTVLSPLPAPSHRSLTTTLSSVLGPSCLLQGRKRGTERLRNLPVTQPARAELGFKSRATAFSYWGGIQGPATAAPHSRELLSNSTWGSSVPCFPLQVPCWTKASGPRGGGAGGPACSLAQAMPWCSPGVDGCAGVEELLGHQCGIPRDGRQSAEA